MLVGGVMAEARRGGTGPGDLAPDGAPYLEQLDTRRWDAGVAGRTLLGTTILAFRGSANNTHHDHLFGPTAESDRHETWFAESSLTGVRGRHTWVAGAAWQQDRFRSDAVPRFNYSYWVPGVFAQDDVKLGQRVVVSASARVDRHSEFGTFVSPRLSTLLRLAPPLTARLSAGRGYFAPTPFTEETEAIGLVPIAPLAGVRPEHATSVSGDLTWARRPFEVTGTLFMSRVSDALLLERGGAGGFDARILNAATPTRTHGTELIARFHAAELDVIATHMFVDSTEWDSTFAEATVDKPGAEASPKAERQVALNPRHTAAVDVLFQVGPARTGIELFYTGRQQLDDNPYRATGAPYVLWGGLVDWGFTERVRGYVNAENLGDVRQTRREPLVRPFRAAGEPWSVDAWSPLEGRTINAGLRIKF
jgi:outer membrane receptor for ferrienterochelin and colicins